jgi:hypothetical protein
VASGVLHSPVLSPKRQGARTVTHVFRGEGESAPEPEPGDDATLPNRADSLASGLCLTTEKLTSGAHKQERSSAPERGRCEDAPPEPSLREVPTA